MPGIQQWQHIFIQELTGIYDPGEAGVIVQWALEDALDMDRTALIIHAAQIPTSPQEQRLQYILDRLKQQEPLTVYPRIYLVLRLSLQYKSLCAYSPQGKQKSWSC